MNCCQLKENKRNKTINAKVTGRTDLLIITTCIVMSKFQAIEKVSVGNLITSLSLRFPHVGI